MDGRISTKTLSVPSELWTEDSSERVASLPHPEVIHMNEQMKNAPSQKTHSNINRPRSDDEIKMPRHLEYAGLI